MSRLHLEFGCGSLKLAGTLDTAPGVTGLLLVSGGNEVRSGAFSGQSHLAEKIAKAGFPVFRFDRRGIGDSQGENRGFRSSAGDIRASLEAFRAMAPQVERVFGFGNCDAASALMLQKGTGFEGLILSNPWTLDQDESENESQPAHDPGSVRARYAEKLKNPSEIARLMRGGVDLRKLAQGIASSFRHSPSASNLAQEMREGLDAFEGKVRILLASKDRTAQLFASAWDAKDGRINHCEGAGHAYVEPDHRQWLEAQILAALRA